MYLGLVVALPTIVFEGQRRPSPERLELTWKGGDEEGLTTLDVQANNISAVQIRDDYERRRQAAQQQTPQDGAWEPLRDEDEENEEPEESSEQKKKRKRQEEKAIAKIKGSKDFQRRKRSKAREVDDDENENENENGVAWDMYKKSKPLPGQLDNCEVCNKRFTVTGYSKTGPEGGLLCPKCSKEQEAGKKKEKPKKKTPGKLKRRETESNRLDGIVLNGAQSLQEICCKKVADNINDVEEFGDLPQALLDRLSQILSKRRVIASRTLDLFLRSDLDTVAIYDCGKLTVDDYKKIFAIVPNIENLTLLNAGQFKDEVMDYVLERGVPLKHIQLEAANLLSNKAWSELFSRRGLELESLKLAWLDYSMEDETIAQMVICCPNLKRLRLKKCFKIGDAAVQSIAQLTKLEHLTLSLKLPVSADSLCYVVSSIRENLRTLCLDNFVNADDNVLAAIHDGCQHLAKFRLIENDLCTDAGFVKLFTDWRNPPLSSVCLSSNRDVDYNQPDGPEESIGLASKGFQALMDHSGSNIERLDISSCRHITHETFTNIFDGLKEYPNLRDLNISFLTRVDTPIVVGMIKSCPRLVKLTAFGCFNIRDVPVPSGMALIGVPNAQDSIIVNGEY
ncbi:MAG: hypothetical protein M1827_002993 [Pycnora praestabilis]|nr:MAG: hypothetical protein M1827_002993 [Pycnora praestabilis]